MAAKGEGWGRQALPSPELFANRGEGGSPSLLGTRDAGQMALDAGQMALAVTL